MTRTLDGLESALLFANSRPLPTIVTFSLLCVPYKYSYLLTEEFLVDNVNGISINNTCKLMFYWKAWNHKDTQIHN